MKKGFFGGTFDPLHFGHLNLAIQMLERGGLDEILFCPTFCSPFKTRHPPMASADHRFAMLKQVICKIPRFRITSIEVDQTQPSFTVDTLRELQEEGVQYRLILSEEAASQLHLWKEPEEILCLAPPLVGARASSPPIYGPFADVLNQARVNTSLFDISSTEIRERLKLGLYCAHLVPREVLDYVERHRLYLLG